MDFLGGVGDPPEEPSCSSGCDGWDTFPDRASSSSRPRPASVIGRVGFNFYDPESWTRSSAPDAQPELTWALAYEHWGKGYATEAALAARKWLGAPHVISLIVAANLASQRVARRLGATPGESIELPGYGPHVVWTHPR